MSDDGLELLGVIALVCVVLMCLAFAAGYAVGGWA
jgi:hypothetical protein